ncbi:SDR family NAD(P)-dependent oxidoreductase [Solirubrobacter ginsenosidimutans]|uniref:SDR family NAD(P)-dependent oxidoreductase n=1 Tax=Solirubrobacter ginsenosidimutans TaxID=490573 RepID=UPI0023492D44
MVTKLVDTLLDRTLIGYSKVGYAARSRGFAPLPRLDGKVVIVTGARVGLGRATVEGLAALGATVHMVVRGREAGETVRDEIVLAQPGADIIVDELDVSLLANVRAYAAAWKGPLYAVVHNAGVMPPERVETAEGHELTLATHVLGPHELTSRLPATDRSIWVSSGGMYAQKLKVDDLEYLVGDYKPVTAYARTKRMQVVLAQEWAKRLPSGVVHAVHPGWVDTPGIADGLPGFKKLTGRILRTPAQGADTTVWLVAAREPGESTGRFWHDRVARPEHYTRLTRESSADRRALWIAVERTSEASA